MSLDNSSCLLAKDSMDYSAPRNYLIYWNHGQCRTNIPEGYKNHILSLNVSLCVAAWYHTKFRLLVVFQENSGPAVWRESRPYTRENMNLRKENKLESDNPDKIMTLTLLLSETMSVNDTRDFFLTPISPEEVSARGSPNRLIILHDRCYELSTGALSQLIAFESHMGPNNMTTTPHLNTSQYFCSIREPDKGSKSVPILPRGISRIITSYAVDRSSLRSCIRAIVRCVLISRNWLEGYSLIWLYALSGDYNLPLTLFNGIIHSMSKDPVFCSSVFKVPPYSDILRAPGSDDLLFRTWTSLFKITPNIRDLTLSSPIFLRCQKPLMSLRAVEGLKLIGRLPSSDTYLLTMNDVLSTIGRWRSLKELNIDAWRYSAFQDLSTYPRYSLKSLYLRDGVLHGSQLLKITSNSAHTLQFIRLTHLNGLTTSDFLQFFQEVGKSLRSIEIHDCSIEDRSSADTCIGLPLDLTIPEMSNLREVQIQAELASNISIAKAVPPPTESHPFISIFGYLGHNTDEVTSRVDSGLVDAMRETNWNAVTIGFNGGLYFEHPGGLQDALAAVYQAAQDRGVVFQALDTRFEKRIALY